MTTDSAEYRHWHGHGDSLPGTPAGTVTRDSRRPGRLSDHGPVRVGKPGPVARPAPAGGPGPENLNLNRLQSRWQPEARPGLRLELSARQPGEFPSSVTVSGTRILPCRARAESESESQAGRPRRLPGCDTTVMVTGGLGYHDGKIMIIFLVLTPT